MAHRTCDGPSCRSVTKFRESNSVKRSVTVCRAYDGPCCSSVVKFRELISAPRFSSLSVLERRSSTDRGAYDGSSYLSSRVMRRAAGELHKCGTTESMTVRRVIRRPSQFLSQMILLLETTKLVVTIDTNLPIIHPRTITRRKIRGRKST